MTKNCNGTYKRNGTANLQLTVRQAAEAMNVSERMVYMARKVRRLAPHLAAKVEAGTMSLNEAHRLATNKPKETTFDRLVRAWNAASDEDRERLLIMVWAAEE